MTKTRVHLAVIPSYEGPGFPGRKVLVTTDLPVFFTAGPIRNAPLWHEAVTRYVVAKDVPVQLVAPIREIAADLQPYVTVDQAAFTTFPRQRALEQHYMYLAGNPKKKRGTKKSGCIMFWLCGEMLPKADPNKVYAHITMFELGKWVERARLIPGTRIVIGTDGNFPEFSTLEFEIKTELGADFPIYRTLEETVDAALTLCGV